MANTGWARSKRLLFEKAFYEFLDNCWIVSKDHVGLWCLGRNLYDSQRRLYSEIFDGLGNDIHDFYILKSRQLGISTGVRALSLFWNGVHDGLQGAIVFDTDPHKITARREMESMIKNLPPSFNFPRPGKDGGTTNRNEMVLSNDSRMELLSAGVKKTKSSGTLGRSSGLSFAHCSEMCSWDNTEGVESFRQSLSDLNPNRLFIWESTARGYNQWFDLWEEARADSTNKKCIFLGWWSKPTQVIERNSAEFIRFGTAEPTDTEMRKINEVRERYGHEITPEQLAWIRKKMNPVIDIEDAGKADSDSDDVTRTQEQPWTEDDAFQMTGATFFPGEVLNNQVMKFASKRWKGYSYAAGIEFTDFRVYEAPNMKSVELKVWEEPVDESVYIIAADVAFGHNDKNDRSAIQVLRAYSDCLEQVAEYAWPLINSKQFAWVIASLMGWYAGQHSEVYLILEMNGPGEATWNELNSLKNQLKYNALPQADKMGLKNIFQNVRNYIYQRSDSMGPGHSWQWITSTRLKVTIFERLRDFVTVSMILIRSMDTLEEMKSISRDGDEIGAEGAKKDDRVFSLALGVRYWEDRVRKKLMIAGRTREFEEKRRRMSMTDQMAIFNRNQLQDLFKIKQKARLDQYYQQMQNQWGRRR